MPELFTIRPAKGRDLFYMQKICEEQGLGVIETVESSSVAVNHEDLPVGFIHIEIVDDEDVDTNAAYVYPVAVFGSWQHHGVARALIKNELEKVGELRLVACNSSQGFYPKVGFEPIAWERIATRIARDCDNCSVQDECDPIPFCVSLTQKTVPSA